MKGWNRLIFKFHKQKGDFLMKMWLVFCGIMEFLIYCMLKRYDYNMVYFEWIKIAFYVVVCIVLNIFMMVKEWDKDIKLRINIAVSLALSSLSGAMTVLFLLKSEEKSVGWITFLIVYVATVILFFWMWTKSGDVVEEESSISKGNGRKAIYTVGLLSAIGFGRMASDSSIRIADWLSLLLLIWIYAFSSLFAAARCKYDFKKIDQKN